jgi:hypothetical protein
LEAGHLIPTQSKRSSIAALRLLTISTVMGVVSVQEGLYENMWAQEVQPVSELNNIKGVESVHGVAAVDSQKTLFWGCI